MADRTNFTITPALEARYWAKVDKRSPNECWPWTAGTNRLGYGRISVEGDGYGATHVALALDGRPRPGRLLALHSCDNPPCQNPHHLRWGTNADNMRDRNDRGRTAKGARSGAYTMPHRTPRGDRHGTVTKPHRIASGERHASRTKPDKIAMGERQHLAKLTEVQVAEIRGTPHFPGICTALARKYGVSQPLISQVLLRKIWKHIP